MKQKNHQFNDCQRLGAGGFTAAWADTAAAPLVEQGFVADLSGDYAQARAYYEQAAKQGHAMARSGSLLDAS
jgi:TPR repeat protein